MNGFDAVIDLIGLWGPQVTAIMALITLDVLLGVGAALRTKTFSLFGLANFYKSMVLPMLLGWIGFVAVGHFVAPSVLGPEWGPLAAQTTAWAAWLAIVAEIGSSIYSNAKIVYRGRLPWQAAEEEPQA